MNKITLEKLELNKVLKMVSTYAVLDKTKADLLNTTPLNDLKSVKRSLDFTEECDKILYKYGAQNVNYFAPFTDELDRAKKGFSLALSELISIGELLRSSRIFQTEIEKIYDNELVIIKDYASKIYFDELLEKDIEEKIISDTQLSDFASEKLRSIRQEIRNLNDKIRSKLASYLTGDSSKYLQEGIITMRDDRYVLPVKVENKGKVKGFIHDRSASGATVFIEPEYILELNNELKTLAFDEKQEVERIISELSHRVGYMSDKLSYNIEILSEVDGYFARAEYSYKNRCVKPLLNDKGVIKIIKGRHPLIDDKKVVPVSLELGEGYRFLLISGPNTGGKTVTLKMCGLFCLLAMCGVFIPAVSGSEVSIFDKIYCDIGDLQSIEESLSTFSSHIKNIIDICDNATEKTFVLIDELGGGTDPEEGQALARAIIEHLLKINCVGIVTTHYSALKEYAYSTNNIENASMEFDINSLLPLYKIKLGLPGSSNAIYIAKRLGLSPEIISSATNNLSDGARKFENIVRKAEESRIEAENSLKETEKLKKEWQEKVVLIDNERQKLSKERDKLFNTAKMESKRIINEKTAKAEELLEEIESIFKQSEISEADIIKARTLKNKLIDNGFDADEEEIASSLTPADINKLKDGDRVFVSALNGYGEVVSVDIRKNTAIINADGIRINCKAKDLLVSILTPNKPITKKLSNQKKVSVVRKVSSTPIREINILGMTVPEGLYAVDDLIDRAIISNLDEVKIIHGLGTGVLKKAVREHLKGHKNVLEFRVGKYGEGENGVTIVKLK